jgi:hypothetical protein
MLKQVFNNVSITIRKVGNKFHKILLQIFKSTLKISMRGVILEFTLKVQEVNKAKTMVQ